MPFLPNRERYGERSPVAERCPSSVARRLNSSAKSELLGDIMGESKEKLGGVNSDGQQTGEKPDLTRSDFCFCWIHDGGLAIVWEPHGPFPLKGSTGLLNQKRTPKSINLTYSPRTEDFLSALSLSTRGSSAYGAHFGSSMSILWFRRVALT